MKYNSLKDYQLSQRDKIRKLRLLRIDNHNLKEYIKKGVVDKKKLIKRINELITPGFDYRDNIDSAMDSGYEMAQNDIIKIIKSM